MSPAKLESPAALRNREPILALLRGLLPPSGQLLEIACGSGEHARFFAAAFPGLRWQPSDLSPAALASTEAHRLEAGLPQLAPPVRLDVRDEDWGVGQVNALYCANMIHIAPFEVTVGLMRGAGRHLADGAPFLLYGPFRVGGRLEAPSNLAFDEQLRARDPSWGIRDLERVAALGEEAGLALERQVAMPANNLSLIFRRLPRGA